MSIKSTWTGYSSAPKHALAEQKAIATEYRIAAADYKAAAEGDAVTYKASVERLIRQLTEEKRRNIHIVDTILDMGYFVTLLSPTQSPY